MYYSGTGLESRFWGAAFNDSGDLCIGYITRERSLRDLHSHGPQITVETDSQSATYTMAKALKHLARFEDRNSVWPKLMVILVTSSC